MKVVHDKHDHGGMLVPPRPSDAHAWNGESWVADAALQQVMLRNQLAEWCSDIDRAADAARWVIAGDPLRALEYQQAAEDARSFLDGGSVEGTVAPTVLAWVTPQRGATQAAQDIVAKASAFSRALLMLRSIRLQTKETIRLQADSLDIEAAQVSRDAGLAQIQGVIQEFSSTSE